MKKRIMRLFPVLLALVMVFGSSLTVFAEQSFDPGDPKYFPKYYDNNFYLSYVEDNGTCYLVQFCPADGYSIDDYLMMKFSSGVKPFLVEDGSITGVNDSNAKCITWYWQEGMDSWEFATEGKEDTTKYRAFVVPSADSVLYCYTSIYNYNGSVFNPDDYFFRMSPYQKARIWKVVETSEVEKVLDQIIAILPICLVCLVGYLALRKALAVLQSLLHQA